MASSEDVDASDDAAEREKAKLQQLIDGMIDAAVVVNHDLQPVLWNRAYAAATAVRPRQLIRKAKIRGTRCRDLFELGVCEDNCLARRAFASGRAVRLDEISARAKLVEGDPQTLIVSAIPIQSDSGELHFVIETYRDVTAEVRIQERFKVLLERERHRAEILEARVRERTADLEHSLAELKRTRTQLVQSEKLSSLGRLAAGLAHELNNPINFIYGNVEFLTGYFDVFVRLLDAYSELTPLSDVECQRLEALKRELDFDYVKTDSTSVLQAIMSGAERAAGIIKDLMVFMHAGSADMGGAVDLSRAVESTVGLIKRQVKDRIELVAEINGPLPTVQGNEGQINQILMNLIMNAIDALGDRGRITIKTAEEDGGVCLVVADNGPGIAPENLVRVFDPFFTTKPVGEGTGLGLSISYSLAESHGGKLTVRSTLGEGASFFLWLPASTP